jgi:hypothetical protein
VAADTPTSAAAAPAPESADASCAVPLRAASVSEIAYKDDGAPLDIPTRSPRRRSRTKSMTAYDRKTAAEVAALATERDHDVSANVELPFVPGAEDSQPLPTDRLPNDMWRYEDPCSWHT